tara:strand:- start:367 stop:618 length:252 start_codon:yes stop_codon:yes gene_type:complete
MDNIDISRINKGPSASFGEAKSQEMYLSDQALGALMMALQKSLLEQSDIVPTLKDFKFKLSEDGLMVMNPPLVKFDHEDEEKE